MTGDEIPRGRVYLGIDPAHGWRPVGRLDGDPPMSMHDVGGVALDINLPSTLTVRGRPGADLRELFERFAQVGRKANIAPVHATQWPDVRSVRAEFDRMVRNPRWPRPTGKRADGESRAAHAGRRRVATAMRRRARRRGVPARVPLRTVLLYPRVRLTHLHADRIAFAAALPEGETL